MPAGISPPPAIASAKSSRPPLRRTRETVALFAAAFDRPPPILIDDGLAEIDHGPDEGQPESQVLARIGAAALADWDHRLIAPPDWPVDADARIAWWTDRLAHEQADNLFVTSNGAARFALATPGLAPSAAALPSLKLRTGAWGEIACGPSGPALVDWNRRPPV